jgi:hypothetical protein
MSSALGITEGLVKGTGSGIDQPGPRKMWSRHVPSFSFSNDQECDVWRISLENIDAKVRLRRRHDTLPTSCGRRKIAHTSIGRINDVGLD